MGKAGEVRRVLMAVPPGSRRVSTVEKGFGFVRGKLKEIGLLDLLLLEIYGWRHVDCAQGSSSFGNTNCWM